MFLHVSVCPQGGSASVHDGIPLDQAHPLGPGTLQQGDHPGKETPPGKADPHLARRPLAQCMLGDTVNKRAVCILLECNLVFKGSFYVKRLDLLVVLAEGKAEAES